MYELDGKVALITGAASGIGAATARLLAEAGARLVLSDIQDEPGNALADELATHTECRYLHHDVGSRAAWERPLAVAHTMGGLNLLVNNAGIAGAGSLWDLTDDAFQRLIDVNLRGVVLGCQLGAPAIAGANNSPGAIVNIASIAAIRGAASLAMYCATKGAVAAFTRAMVAECAVAGYTQVRCNAVLPGLIRTPIWDDITENLPLTAAPEGANAAQLDDIAALRVPTGTVGEPSQVGQLIRYLLSAHASYISGQCYVVDGGMTAIG